ncbi:MAG: hypothetical protein IJM95_07295, partial [Anaerotignum sp.]|nr:hypothetical protein [Anaerotignum sp.]
MKEIRITKNEENQRLDKFLLKYMNKATKGFLYKMLRKKRIKLNGGRAEGNELLHAGDTLQLYLAEETIQSFMEEKTVAQAKRHFACGNLIRHNAQKLRRNRGAKVSARRHQCKRCNARAAHVFFHQNQRARP